MSKSTFHTRLAMALAADPREQRAIAKEIGSSPQQVSRWKRDVSPSPDIIAKFVLRLRKSMCYRPALWYFPLMTA